MQVRKGAAFLRKQKGAYAKHLRTLRSKVPNARKIRAANFIA